MIDLWWTYKYCHAPSKGKMDYLWNYKGKIDNKPYILIQVTNVRQCRYTLDFFTYDKLSSSYLQSSICGIF